MNSNGTESSLANLFTGKVFADWPACDLFISNWARNKGFNVIKGHVDQREGVIRRRTYICEHGRKVNNPDSAIFVNKIVDDHNHNLRIESILFEQNKRFSEEMMEDVQFLTQYCKMRATAQRRYLKGKYPSQSIYSEDLYNAIKKFHPTAKSLFNNAAQMSDWLDQQKKKDSRWIVARGWNDDNALIHLLWMTPKQVENWIQFFDCVLNDQIIKATNIHPTVILTDSDPAVDVAIMKIFPTTYPIHCAFHITQNLHKNLQKLLEDDYKKFLQDFYQCRNNLIQITFYQRFTKLVEDYPKTKCYLEGLYKSKEYWAHSYTNFKFTGGMIATLRVESVDECCQNFLTPAILKMQHNEINQSLYYVVNLGQTDIISNEIFRDDDTESLQTTIKQLLEVVSHDNVKEIWDVKVGNSQKMKHHIVLLKNGSHVYSCLSIIQQGIVCKHYFQVMLNTSEAKFHIRLIPSRWYQKEKDGSYKPFIVADKFNNEKDDLLEQRMGTLDQKIMYGTLHGMYKKALQKALQNKSNSLRLIKILKEFADEDSECEDNDESEEIESNKEADSFGSDKENINVFQL
ncbi:protein FAR1-related sequence 11-like isoform X1 [Rhizophagus clarus]|uniref:Protein FAR1-related sequence 11-like isoform X1 n=1 Tax=Rhizophagus clarus TaxID=94130 RepID=A0A8H3M0D9_9GLOM|nr:protein FAR1-related sequence 11-like isoform X1 [Rhizophagus clarus]